MAVSKKKPPFALKGLTTDKRSVIIMATYRQNASYDFISKKPWDPATAEVIDDEGGTTNKNALPFGLCKKFGISLPDGARPRDAWEALKQHGVYPPWTDEGEDQYTEDGLKEGAEEAKKGEEAKEAEKPEQRTEEIEKIFSELSRRKVDYYEVNKLKNNLTHDEIVTKIAGGDSTGGSCASAALCYVANKLGLDVLDFRGGKSREFFSHDWEKIASIPELKTVREKDTNDVKAVARLLDNAEYDKEYLLITGRHCSVIRRVKGKGFEYLELQASNPNDNGFKQLTTKLLSWRFRCKKSHTTVGFSYKATSELIDVDNFKNIKEFSSIMGYINTPADKQQKGIRGHEK